MKKLKVQDFMLTIVLVILLSFVAYVYYWGTVVDNSPKDGVVDVRSNDSLFIPVPNLYPHK